MACAKWFITRGIAAVSLFGAVCFAAPSWTIQSWSAEPPTIRLGYGARRKSSFICCWRNPTSARITAGLHARRHALSELDPALPGL